MAVCRVCGGRPGEIEECEACSGRGEALSLGWCPNGWDEVHPGLFVGGHDRAWVDGDEEGWFGAAPVRVGGEFDVVVSLYVREGYGPDASIEHHHYRMADSRLGPEDAHAVNELAHLVAQRVRDGKRVLVRCQAGINRSSLVAALALVELGHSAEEALSAIRTRRNIQCLFNPHFVEHIETVAAQRSAQEQQAP